MGLEISLLHPTFGGEVSGIDLAIAPDANTVATLREAMDRYAVLVFPAQHLTDENQIEFARLFGTLERSAFTYRPGATHRLKQPEMVDVSNLDASTGAAPKRRAAPDDQPRQPSVAHRQFIQVALRRSIDVVCARSATNRW